MSKKPKLAKGTEELLGALQDQVKEIKAQCDVSCDRLQELKRDKEKLRLEVAQWEREWEKKQQEGSSFGGVYICCGGLRCGRDVWNLCS